MSILKGLKSLVSQDRIRFQEDGFDLDLSYITDNILGNHFTIHSFIHPFNNNKNNLQNTFPFFSPTSSSSFSL